MRQKAAAFALGLLLSVGIGQAALYNPVTIGGVSGAGTMASQNANAVAITGGTVTGITDLALADGGTGASTAANARTNLGGTTIGQAFFTLANPGAITFARIDAANTVTARSAANFRTDLGVGTGDSPTFTAIRAGSAVAPTVALDVTGAALISSTLGVTGTIASGGNAAASPAIAINGGSGFRSLNFQTAGVNRWLVIANSDAESVSDAGSAFQILARADAGGAIDSPIFITRASAGEILLGGTSARQTGFTGNINLASGKVVKYNGTAIKVVNTYTATYDPATLAALASRCDDVTVTGITTAGGAVSANIGAVDPAAGCVVATVRASADNTVRICWRNVIDAITACDTSSSTWTFSQPQ